MVVRIRLAGQLGLTVDGRPVPTATLTRHATIAMAYLVLERGRRVARSELVDALWEAGPPPSWKAALRGTISRVRSVLAGGGLDPTALATGSGWYEMRLPADTAVDLESAVVAVERAEALLRGGAGSAPLAAAQRAYEVVRLPVLAGVQAVWVETRQSWLDELRLRCLEVMASVAVHNGDWPDARTAAGQVLGLAPLRESAHRLLALAFAGSGDRGEALRVLDDCRRVLAEQLGAFPSPETQTLLVGLLRGATLLELRAGTAPEP